MADNRKYYYMRVQENFYEREEIRLLESMDNGILYSNILMKLYLKSLKRDGKLMFNDVIPYTPEILSKILNVEVGTMRFALDLFKQLGLVEIFDNGAIFMLNIQEFIGKTSTEADRKKAYRLKIEEAKGQMSGQIEDKRTPEIEIEIEKEIKNKKEKGGINALIDGYTTNEELKQCLKDFIKMRAAKKKQMTDRALKMLLNALDNLESTDERKIKVLEQSILNSWNGVFPLKEQKENQKKVDSNIDYVNV